MEMVYENPIIPGFFPDPSCIRVGEIFYMIHSSFQFFPGLPIHSSTDLVNWKLVGHAICRPDQLDLSLATTKINNITRKEVFTGGLYAPTIRYRDGIFYIVCTNLTGHISMPSDEDFQPQNFLISCNDLSNPNAYSEPIYFDFHGIDPSLFFDDDGKVYLQGSYIHGYRRQPATVIRQAEIDIETGQLKSEAVDVWQGSGGKVPEGPHLYKKDGYYWLLIAEGGTHRGHKITMARSRNVWGPFEPFEHNPVLTGTRGSPIQCVGHGELFQDLDGKWWACMLARREFGDSYPLGRETYLVPVAWPDGEFPTFEPVQLRQVCIGRKIGTKLRCDNSCNLVNFSSPGNVYLRTPDLKNYIQKAGSHVIMLNCSSEDITCAGGTCTFLGQRQTSLTSFARVEINLSSLPERSHSGLTVYKDPHRHASLNLNQEKSRLSLAVCDVQDGYTHTNSAFINNSKAIRLTIKSYIQAYEFFFSLLLEGKWSEDESLGTVISSKMSGDDFTGTIFGVYASGGVGMVEFSNFEIWNSKDSNHLGLD